MYTAGGRDWSRRDRPPPARHCCENVWFYVPWDQMVWRIQPLCVAGLNLLHWILYMKFQSAKHWRIVWVQFVLHLNSKRIDWKTNYRVVSAEGSAWCSGTLAPWLLNMMNTEAVATRDGVKEPHPTQRHAPHPPSLEARLAGVNPDYNHIFQLCTQV